MKKRQLFPVIYGLISALISFIAIFFICQHSFHLCSRLALLIAGICGLLFFVLSWFRGHASIEIKRIVAKYHLSDSDLAKLTGLKASDFPIYHDQLQLVLPKRYWPRVLDALQKYEKQREQMKI